MLFFMILLITPMQVQDADVQPRLVGYDWLAREMLTNPSVIAELRADAGGAEWLKQMKEKYEKMNNNFYSIKSKMLKNDRVPRDDVFHAFMIQELSQELRSALKPSQYKRFVQINIQWGFIDSVLDESVRRPLKLSEDQARQVMAIEKEFLKSVGENYTRNRGNRKKFMDESDASRRSMMERFLSLLDQEQRATWADLIGKDFPRKQGSP